MANKYVRRLSKIKDLFEHLIGFIENALRRQEKLSLSFVAKEIIEVYSKQMQSDYL